MKSIVIHCRYTSHHFAIKKVIHGLVTNLDYKDPDLKYKLLVNKNNISDFSFLDELEYCLIPVHSDNALLNHLFNIFVLPILLLIWRADVIVFPQISFFLVTGKKTITFIHDLIEFRLRNQSWKKHIVRHLFFPHVARKSDIIVTVSNSSKNDIVNLMGVCPDKVHVAYDGVDHIKKYSYITNKEAAKYVENKFGLHDYYLYVGYLTLPQKNLIRLVDAYHKFITTFEGQFPRLVFVGPKGKDHDKIFSRVDKLRLGEHFHYLGTVDEKDLACLYKSSRVFCFPSLYEGFGMPVAEAMSCGCAVVTSNTSSLPEVAGNAALLIDPENEDEIFSALAYLYENPDKVKELTTLAQTRAELFSWKTFSNTVRSLF